LLRFGCGDLVGPGDAGARACAEAGGVRFGVVGSFFVGGIVPVVPAGGVEVGRELGVDVDDAGVGAPAPGVAASMGRASWLMLLVTRLCRMT